MGHILYKAHYAQYKDLINLTIGFSLNMSTEFKFKNHPKQEASEASSKSKVTLTDLLHRLNEEKKIEKKRNLALSVAAASAVTVFGIILTL